MNFIRIILLLMIQAASCQCIAQTDSIFQTLQNLQQIPVNYINAVDKKIDKYNSRITSKTEKTLVKLSHWENKIKDIL